MHTLEALLFVVSVTLCFANTVLGNYLVAVLNGLAAVALFIAPAYFA